MKTFSYYFAQISTFVSSSPRLIWARNRRRITQAGNMTRLVVAWCGRSERASRVVEDIRRSVFCWLLWPWISLTVTSYNARYLHQYVHLFTTSIIFTPHSCLTVRIPSARSALPYISFTLACVSVCFRNIHTTRPCDLRRHAHSAARSPVNHWPARRRDVVAVAVAPTVGISWNSKNRETNCDISKWNTANLSWSHCWRLKLTSHRATTWSGTNQVPRSAFSVYSSLQYNKLERRISIVW